MTTKIIGERLVWTVGAGLWRLGGVPAFIPDPPELETVRAWLAMGELARADGDLDAAVQGVEEDLGSLLRLACSPTPGAETSAAVLAVVLAVVRGLWSAVCRPADPLSVEEARRLLLLAWTALGVPTPDRPGQTTDSQTTESGSS